MITEQAQVTRYHNGRAELALQRNSVCHHCELKQGCGIGVIGWLLGNRRKPIVIETEQLLKPGDRVSLSLPERAMVKASLLIYGMPLMGLIMFSVLTQITLALPEWMVVLAGISGFWLGLAIVRRFGFTRLQDLLLIKVVAISSESARFASVLDNKPAC